MAEMTITHLAFCNELVSARQIDEFRWTRLNLEAWLWTHFAFINDGAVFFNTGEAPSQPQWPPVIPRMDRDTHVVTREDARP